VALSKAIDALHGSVNLGGSGGSNRGKTPEVWAAEITRKSAANSLRN
jgi:hypothetical protein